MSRRLEDEAVCFYRMFVPDGSLDRNIVNHIRAAFSQDLYALEIRPQIRQNNRVLIQSIVGSEDCATLLCPSVGHSLNHNVNIPTMVQVLMR